MSKTYNTYDEKLVRIINKDGVDCLLVVVGKERTPFLTKLKRFFKKPKKKFFMIDTKEIKKAIYLTPRVGIEEDLIW